MHRLAARLTPSGLSLAFTTCSARRNNPDARPPISSRVFFLFHFFHSTMRPSVHPSVRAQIQQSYGRACMHACMQAGLRSLSLLCRVPPGFLCARLPPSLPSDPSIDPCAPIHPRSPPPPRQRVCLPRGSARAVAVRWSLKKHSVVFFFSFFFPFLPLFVSLMERPHLCKRGVSNDTLARMFF